MQDTRPFAFSKSTVNSGKEDTIVSKGIQSDKKSAYAQAGVNIDVKMNAVGSIKEMVASTKTQSVIGNIGAFGGLHKVPTGKDEILVASTDGVGTKLKVAAMMGRHDTVGQDIVNHCVNDILVQGALPLFFMDYVGTAKVDPAVFKSVDIQTESEGLEKDFPCEYGPKESRSSNTHIR